MQFWDAIVNTALMGTDKKQINAADIPVGLEEAATFIHANTSTDKEEKFLQLAAVALVYRQCGILPLRKELRTTTAPLEEKAYCNENASQVLNEIIGEDSIPLLKFWLQLCNEKKLLITPELVTVILSKGVEQKKLQSLVAACCGKRGEWLGSLNPAWNFSSMFTADERWETGSPEQRKEILRTTRITDPAKSREWLQQTWSQEDANTKTSLLETIANSVAEDDIPFLESLAAEKSKKVKDMAMQLLKQVPSSAIVKMYEQALSSSFVIKKEKALLGMLSKTTLQCKIPGNFDESVYKTGIDKLSNSKELTDDEYIVSQLVKAVPPTFLERHLDMTPEQIIELFQKDNTGKKLMPSLVNAITHFRDTRWALHLMQHSQVFYIDIIPLLQEQYQEAYSIKVFSQFPDDIINYAIRRDAEWSIELTKNIFRHAAKNPYQYNRSFYNQHIHLIPIHIVGELEKCTPPEEQLRGMWSNISEYIMRLISMKIQTIKAFNT